MTESTAAIDENAHWVDALTGIGLGDDARAPAPDLALFFASPLYPDLPNLVGQAFRRSAASVMVRSTWEKMSSPSRANRESDLTWTRT